MLTLKNIATIAGVVEDNANIKLTAMPSTPVSQLSQSLIEMCEFNKSQLTKDEDKDIEINDILALVSEVSADKQFDDIHVKQMDEYSTVLADVMTNNIYLARSVVLPVIEQYSDELNEYIHSNNNISNVALNIVEDRKWSILTIPQLKTIVEPHAKRTAYDDIKLPRYHLVDRGIPSLLNLIETGSHTFDSAIKQWIDVNQLEPLIKDTYKHVFMMGSKNISFTKYHNVNTYSTNIVALLICWGLVKNVEEGVDVSLKQYKHDMEVFANSCCGLIAQAIKKQERRLKRKQLVVSFPEADREYCYDTPELNTIVVDPHAYHDFLENGGSPELIFGSYLADRIYTADGILADAKRLTKVYNTYLKRSELTKANKVLSIAKTKLLKMLPSIENDIKNTGDGDGAVSFSNSEHMVNARTYISKISEAELKDIYGLMRRLVCVNFMNGTLVPRLLELIDLLDPENTGDIHETALVATTDLIVDWLINQTTSKGYGISLEGYYITGA